MPKNYKKQHERVHGDTNYEKMNAHIDRMLERVEKIGVQCWSGDSKKVSK
jgi:hypothetical protein